ncbi:hypothetical protein GQ55_5G344800 [Panicum hallii var. hallii]|uniref:Uncharacterized protein n=1 Tax=Panicum hallii var. hallii TaxID=1504633 RepID=A0A2T7DM51_9POAL|nr:hypothetical protein GQ55_5G344800 [Panicum hallii var. hallii]
MIRDHRQLKSPAHTAPTSRRPPSSAASRGPGARHPPPTREAPGTRAPRSSPRPLLPAPPAAPHDPPLAPHVMPPPSSAASRGPGARHPLLLARHLGRAPRSFRRPLLPAPPAAPRDPPLTPHPHVMPPGAAATSSCEVRAATRYARQETSAPPPLFRPKKCGHSRRRPAQVITFHFLDLCLQQDDKISYRMDQ